MKWLRFWETDAEQPQTFDVTVGELRDALGKPRDGKTDNITITVPYIVTDAPEGGDDDTRKS